MKSNLLRTFLEWALITSVLMSAGFFAWYWIQSRKVHVCQSQLAAANDQFQRGQTIMGQLGKDCDEYAKTSPDFARLMDQLKGQPSASVPPKLPAK
jgi:hypothetical protein